MRLPSLWIVHLRPPRLHRRPLEFGKFVPLDTDVWLDV